MLPELSSVLYMVEITHSLSQKTWKGDIQFLISAENPGKLISTWKLGNSKKTPWTKKVNTLHGGLIPEEMTNSLLFTIYLEWQKGFSFFSLSRQLVMAVGVLF